MMTGRDCGHELKGRQALCVSAVSAAGLVVPFTRESNRHLDIMRSMSKWAALLLIPAALLPAAGCVRYHARPVEPQRTEREYRSRSLADPGLKSFVESQSRSPRAWPPEVLDLDSLDLIAAYYSPELDVARARVRSAEAAIATAHGRVNPRLSTGAGHESGPESPLLFAFEPTLTLVTAGKRGYQILQAEKSAEAARLDLVAAAWQLRSTLRTRLANHIYALQSLELSRAERSLRGEKAAMLEKRLTVGEAARPELDAARAELEAAGAAVRAAEGMAASGLVNLAESAGLPVQAIADCRFSWPAPEDPKPDANLSANRLQQEGLLNRIDVRRTLLEYAASEASLQLEVARQYPDIDLTPGYSYDEGHNKFTLGSSIPVPLINRNRGPIGEAEARRAEAEARFVAVQSQAIADMERARTGYSAVLGEFEEAQKSAAVQDEIEKAAVRSFESGETDRLSLVTAKLARLAASRVRLEVFRRAQAAFGTLEDAVQQPLLTGTPQREIHPVSPRAATGEEKRP